MSGHVQCKKLCLQMILKIINIFRNQIKVNPNMIKNIYIFLKSKSLDIASPYFIFQSFLQLYACKVTGVSGSLENIAFLDILSNLTQSPIFEILCINQHLLMSNFRTERGYLEKKRRSLQLSYRTNYQLYLSFFNFLVFQVTK